MAGLAQPPGRAGWETAGQSVLALGPYLASLPALRAHAHFRCGICSSLWHIPNPAGQLILHYAHTCARPAAPLHGHNAAHPAILCARAQWLAVGTLIRS